MMVGSGARLCVGSFLLVVLLLFLAHIPALLTLLWKPVLYTLAAVAAPALLLLAASGQQGATTPPPPDSHSSAGTQGDLPKQPIGGAVGAAADVFTSAAVLGSSSASGPPCGVSCSSSNCPWHLPMAPSLSSWSPPVASRFSDSSHATNSGGGKRPSSSTDDLTKPLAQQAPAEDLQSFSFHSTAADGTGEAPATTALLRSLSAPLAGTFAKAAGASAVCGDTGTASSTDPLLAAGAADAGAHGQLYVGQLQDTRLVEGQPTPGSPASGVATAVLCAPGAAAPEVQDDGPHQRKQLAPQQAAKPRSLQRQAGKPAAAAAGAASAGPNPALSGSSQQRSVSPQADSQTQQQQQHGEGEPRTPHAQVQPEMLAVLHHILKHDSQHVQEPDQERQQQQPLHTVQQDQQQQAAPQCAHQRQQQQQEHHQQAAPQCTQQQQHPEAGLMTPTTTRLPFIATSSRHSMCMRQPSFCASGSPLSTSAASSGGGFAAWVPPLPSPSDSPLVRRLSERDDTGLPVASPALQELLSSGGGSSSRRQLYRGCSLDGCRAVGSPGVHAWRELSSMHEQADRDQHQEAPWAGMQLRSVAHLLQQRQQLVHQLSPEQVEGSPWYKQYQLDRRHTFHTGVQLSVAADGAGAAVGSATATGAAAVEAAVLVGADDGEPPCRSVLLWSSGGTGVLHTGTASPGFASISSSTPHRLSCCSSVHNLQFDTETAEGDASADVLCAGLSGAAGSRGLRRCRPLQSLMSHRIDFADWDFEEYSS